MLELSMQSRRRNSGFTCKQADRELLVTKYSFICQQMRATRNIWSVLLDASEPRPSRDKVHQFTTTTSNNFHQLLHYTSKHYQNHWANIIEASKFQHSLL